MAGRSIVRLLALVAGLAACAGQRPADSGHGPGVELDFAKDIRSYAVGWGVICALDPGGYPHCWGDDEWYQLDVPDVPLVMLVANFKSVCGLEEDGQARCWGGDHVSDAGPGNQPEPDKPVVNIEAGAGRAYGILPDGNVVQWLLGGGAWSPEIDE